MNETLINPFTKTLEKYGYIKPSGDIVGIEEPLADSANTNQSCNTCNHQLICRCWYKLNTKLTYDHDNLDINYDDAAMFIASHCKEYTYAT